MTRWDRQAQALGIIEHPLHGVFKLRLEKLQLVSQRPTVLPDFAQNHQEARRGEDRGAGARSLRGNARVMPGEGNARVMPGES